jgi:RHS repeat-associated protein
VRTTQIYTHVLKNKNFVQSPLDAAGNTTADPQGRTFTYDGENKQKEVRDQYNTVTGQYRYDASGRMVAEYSTIVEPTATAKISYLTTDYLGSPRINTDSNGNVTTRQDLHPYGEEIPSTLRSPGLGYVGDDVRRKFTVYQRDEELDLDYARLRMYANRLGRFLSVDPIAPDIFTPPSLNRYQYCLNNPGRFVDSSGDMMKRFIAT